MQGMDATRWTNELLGRVVRTLNASTTTRAARKPYKSNGYALSLEEAMAGFRAEYLYAEGNQNRWHRLSPLTGMPQAPQPPGFPSRPRCKCGAFFICALVSIDVELGRGLPRFNCIRKIGSIPP
jgi:hypothetical protein